MVAPDADAPPLADWRELAARYVTALCGSAEAAQGAQAGALAARIAAPDTEALEAFAADAPPMTGAEYLTAPALRALWEALDASPGAASAALAGAARVRRREEQGAAAFVAAARAARGRGMRLGQGDGRCGRDLPSAALDAGRGAAVPWRRFEEGDAYL